MKRHALAEMAVRERQDLSINLHHVSQLQEIVIRPDIQFTRIVQEGEHILFDAGYVSISQTSSMP